MKQEHSPDGASTATHAAEQARLDDIGIAQAIARAARTVRGVAGISPGHVVVIATYGGRERVLGVGLWRTEDGALCVEVHVTLDARVVAPPASTTSRLAAGSGLPEVHGAPTLLSLADQIRLAIHDAIHALDLPPPARIDVAMDDMV